MARQKGLFFGHLDYLLPTSFILFPLTEEIACILLHVVLFIHL